MSENRIAELVKRLADEQVKKELGASIDAKISTANSSTNKKPNKQQSQTTTVSEHVGSSQLTKEDYPLGVKHPKLAKSLTGKGYEDIKPENVLDGSIKPEDIRISPEVLEYQAQVAESVGKKQFASNLRRAAEMTSIPDDKVLKFYEMLRPGRCSYEELIAAAEEIETVYRAKRLSDLFRDAAGVYKTRNVLK